ncbi:MAG: hypothetical protein ACQESR_23865 [Planctomycetota bacterium]
MMSRLPGFFALALAAIVVLAANTCSPASAKTKELGNGFRDHGVATPISNSRGLVSTSDGDGNNVVLVWLMDHRGGYAILMIDAKTGESEQFPVPWDRGHDSPFASLLSSDNVYYTHFDSHFCAFDPEKPGFTCWEQTKPRMAMGMTESDEGLIHAVTYPNSGVVQFDPDTGVMTDFGYVYHQNWPMYQRDVACDAAGWLYFGVGNTKAQIVAFNPKTEEATPLFDEVERPKGRGVLYRDQDGKVYGHLNQRDWYAFYEGEKNHVGPELPQKDPITNIVPARGTDATQTRTRPTITGSQALFWRRFPDGTRLARCDLVDRAMVTESPAGKRREVEFDYDSEGAHLMGVNIAPNNTVCGGTAFPMRFFSYDPSTDTWVNRPAYGQFNTVATRGEHWYVGGYTHGWLLEWDSAEPWVNTQKDNPNANPRFITEAYPTVNRPHALLPHPDGETVILGGTPAYGYTGGGLLFWNAKTGKEHILKHTDLAQWQAPHSLLDLPNRKLLCGLTVSPGTGGERKAAEAELVILDIDTKKITWRGKLFDHVASYYDLCHGPDGLVYGLVGTEKFYVFNPETKKIVHEKDLAKDFGRTTGQQGPRVFVTDPKDTVYILFNKGIGRINPDEFSIEWVADAPVGIGPGGDYYDGRIYFGSGSHLISYEVPE